MDFEIIVQPKKEVLDPEGRTITETLQRVGFTNLEKVEVSKRYVVSIEHSDSAEAEEEANVIASAHLSNPVAETYEVHRVKS